MKEEEQKPNNSGNWIKISAAALTFLVIFTFFVSISHRLVVFRSSFLAEVLPRVLIDLTNQNRLASNINQLKYSSLLEEAAKRKAEDMANKSYFAHQSPEGITPWYWFKDVNYNFVYAGENLAIHFSDSADVVNAWMDSPSHRDNILNQHFTEIGIATASGYYEGRQTVFVVQMFGRPSASSVAFPISEEVFALETDLNTDNINNDDIKGASTDYDDSQIEEIFSESKEDGKFLVVENLTAVDQIPEETSDEETVAGEHIDYSNPVERLLVRPSLLLEIVYFTLGIIILFTMLFLTLAELKKHHYFHIVYGFGIIVLMIVMYFVYTKIFGTVEVLSPLL